MTIHFDNGSQSTHTATSSRRQRTISLISAKDLRAACAHLQRKISDYQLVERRPVRIRVTIGTDVEKYSAILDDGSPVPGNQLHKYLEPFRQVRGANEVEIDGPAHPSYIAGIKTTMLGSRLRAAELMELVTKHLDHGDSAFREGNLKMANSEYRLAVSIIQSIKLGNYWDDDFREVVARGRYRGIWTGLARNDASVRLHTLIADLYLQSGDLRLARVYVERLYRPLYNCVSPRSHKQKFPLRLPRHSNTATYGDLLLVAARISLACGNDGQASGELWEASRLDPANLQIVGLLDECSTRLKERSGRRNATQKRQRNCAKEKLLGMLFTTCR